MIPKGREVWITDLSREYFQQAALLSRQTQLWLSEKSLREALDGDRAFGLAALAGTGRYKKIAGIAIYVVYGEGDAELRYIAVDDGHRRKGVGSALLRRIQKPLAYLDPRTIHCLVNEYYLDIQLLLKSLAFKALGIKAGVFDHPEVKGWKCDGFYFQAAPRTACEVQPQKGV